MQEKGSLIAQLEALRRESKGKGQESSIDAFSHRLDQVSEASIKSGVESLNDALDDLVMNILEKGDQLAQKHAHLVRPFSERDWYDDPNPLLIALGRSDLTDDNRGLLLDVRLHDQLHAELYDLFFSGDAISSRIDTGGLIQAIWDALIQKESWTVAQRWRALTASTVSTLVDESGFAESIANNAQEIIQVLVYVHGLTSTEFEDISEILFSGLEALYKEAKELAIRVRRDILSVRMTVTSVLETRFDPSRASSVWPEMGAVAGDDIVGRYRFGLMKLTEHGERSYLVRPEVATTALIRETAKNN
ncbi:hypothetical protein C8R46DRAFT_912850 [Mycena filopes]|nr:hypothetical protein C8R46DRAFT_912850 [Mycena filopes]